MTLIIWYTNNKLMKFSPFRSLYILCSVMQFIHKYIAKLVVCI